MNNLNWLDILTIIILVLFVVDGLLKGFVQSLFDTLGFIAAFYIAKELSAYSSRYISENTGIYKKLYECCALKTADNTVIPALKIIGGQGLIQSTLAQAIITMVSFAVIFVVARFILHAIFRVLNTAARLPVIRQFNSLGGFIIGGIKGIIIIYIAFAVLTPIIPLLSPSHPLVKAVETSSFAVNFYKYNFILSVLNNII